MPNDKLWFIILGKLSELYWPFEYGFCHRALVMIFRFDCVRDFYRDNMRGEMVALFLRIYTERFSYTILSNEM